ncbi:hypothetical protein COO60DRAFT_1157784 [Scenedesmus sp. NREL 46B-D3]|nr:hypothetical protein COO60DRAFT_1157784 [Scenedesmus sp. NREL 46B-D3]
MAGRTGQQAGAGPQYSLPKFSAEEQWVQKKQGEFIQGDVRMLGGIDVEKPFQNVQDAVQRLLPFHLFGAVDAADADLDDTPDCGGADLMSNRHEAWQELCISKANDLRKRADNSAAQIAALEKQIEAEALSGSRSLDRLAMVKLQQEDLKRKVAAEKAVLAPLMTPPAAAQQQQVAVAAAGKGAPVVALVHREQGNRSWSALLPRSWACSSGCFCSSSWRGCSTCHLHSNRRCSSSSCSSCGSSNSSTCI